MKHYVLTRSVYGPTWSEEANTARLGITRAVTARLMAAQTVDDWTWIVALHPEDPNLEARKAVFAAAAPRFIPILWTPDRLEQAPWARPKDAPSVNSLVAVAAYRAPWRSVMEPDGDRLVQTRLDDDDGLAVTAIDRYQQAASNVVRRTILLFPIGLRINGSRYQPIRHRSNAMQSLVTLPGDDLCVYDYGHNHCAEVAPVRPVDRQIGWLWVRHRDTISDWKKTNARLTDTVRRVFPVDWAVVEAAA